MATIATPTGTNEIANIPEFPRMALAVTKSDADVFAEPVNIFVGGGGVVACRPWNAGASGTVVNVTVPDGGYVPFAVCMVMSTNTTATLMVAVY